MHLSYHNYIMLCHVMSPLVPWRSSWVIVHRYPEPPWSPSACEEWKWFPAVCSACRDSRGCLWFLSSGAGCTFPCLLLFVHTHTAVLYCCLHYFGQIWCCWLAGLLAGLFDWPRTLGRLGRQFGWMSLLGMVCWLAADCWIGQRFGLLSGCPWSMSWSCQWSLPGRLE